MDFSKETHDHIGHGCYTLHHITTHCNALEIGIQFYDSLQCLAMHSNQACVLYHHYFMYSTRPDWTWLDHFELHWITLEGIGSITTKISGSNALQCTPISTVSYIIIISCIPPDLIEHDWSTLHRIGAHWKKLDELQLWWVGPIPSNALQSGLCLITIISYIPPDLIEPDWSTLHRIGAHWKELEELELR